MGLLLSSRISYGNTGEVETLSAVWVHICGAEIWRSLYEVLFQSLLRVVASYEQVVRASRFEHVSKICPAFS